MPRTARPRTPANAPIVLPSSFDQLRAQAAESVTRNAWRLREVAEIYREKYRDRLDEWVQLRARVDHRVAAHRGTGPSPSVLRADREPTWKTEPYEVPASQWYVLADNREWALDSRWWGAVDASTVKGVVRLRIGPSDELGTKKDEPHRGPVTWMKGVPVD